MKQSKPKIGRYSLSLFPGSLSLERAELLFSILWKMEMSTTRRQAHGGACAGDAGPRGQLIRGSNSRSTVRESKRKISHRFHISCSCRSTAESNPGHKVYSFQGRQVYNIGIHTEPQLYIVLIVKFKALLLLVCPNFSLEEVSE